MKYIRRTEFWRLQKGISIFFLLLWGLEGGKHSCDLCPVANALSVVLYCRSPLYVRECQSSGVSLGALNWVVKHKWPGPVLFFLQPAETGTLQVVSCKQRLRFSGTIRSFTRNIQRNAVPLSRESNPVVVEIPKALKDFLHFFQMKGHQLQGNFTPYYSMPSLQAGGVTFSGLCLLSSLPF